MLREHTDPDGSIWKVEWGVTDENTAIARAVRSGLTFHDFKSAGTTFNLQDPLYDEAKPFTVYHLKSDPLQKIAACEVSNGVWAIGVPV